MTTTEIIQLGAVILQTVFFLFAGGAVVLRTQSSNKELREDIKAMQEELKGLANVITTQAVQDQRLNEQSRRMTMLEERVDRLKRGIGWEQDHTAKTVDREY